MRQRSNYAEQYADKIVFRTSATGHERTQDNFARSSR